METVNIVIDESLESSSKKFSEEIPKEILPPEPKDVQEFLIKSPHLQVLLALQVL